MTREEVERIIQGWFEGAETGGDPELEYEDRHPDCVIEIPQSGEVFDRDGVLGMQREFPGGAPRMKLVRLTGHGDEWTLEARFDYGPERGGVFHNVMTLEFKDGKIIRETRYYAEPFPPPENRAKWTQSAARS
jgi:hypothetical protein